MTTADQWIAQFKLKRRATRELWIAIRREFQQQKPPMTVRQMFYRMSAQGMVDKSENGYDRVGYALKNMRFAGAIPFGWIADNTRWVRKQTTYSGIADMLAQQRKLYRRALWDSQPAHVEIWLEKDALAGVIDAVTSVYDVPLYVTRGYPSLTYVYDAAESLKAIDKPKFIYHFGDFDASGKDAARDIRDKLRTFGAQFDFIEVAVIADQIDALALQTRPAKKTDSRAKNFGDVAVELDAIPPNTLRQMVREVIEQHIDTGELEMLQSIEAGEIKALDGLISQFWSSLKSA